MKQKWNQWLVLSVLTGTFGLQGMYAQEDEMVTTDGTVVSEDTTVVKRPHPVRMGRVHSESLAAADTDANGLVSAEEFAASVDYSTRVADILTQFDADEDGNITGDEVASVHASAVEERLAGVLARWDADEDGQITAEELDAVGKGSRGHRFVLEGFDADEDGIITSDELLSAGSSMLEDHVSHLQVSYDADEDGIITTEELNAAHAAKVTAQWEALLGKLDADADGLISSEEIAAATPANRGQLHAHDHDDSEDHVETDSDADAADTESVQAPSKNRHEANRRGGGRGRR